jgi:hypothetical protein
VGEQKIETQILEDVEDVLGVKAYVCQDSTTYSLNTPLLVQYSKIWNSKFKGQKESF